MVSAGFGVLLGEVDLVVGAVEAEPDRFALPVGMGLPSRSSVS